MSKALESTEPNLSEAQLLGVTAGQGIVFTALGLGLWWFTGRPIQEWITLTSQDLFIGVATTAALIALALVGFCSPRISEYLIRMQRESYGWLTKFHSWRVILFISFFAGVWEEALFRGGVQVLLTDFVGAPLAIILASVVFAAVHLSKPVIGFLQFLIGCLFGVIYWQTGSLLGVMLAHFLYDIFALWYLLRELTKLEEDEARCAPE